MARTDEALIRLFDVAGGLADMLDRSRAQADLDRTAFKAQCFDLVTEAIVAAATTLAADAGTAPEVRERARAVAARLAAHQRTSVDWKCPVCGRDVAKAAAITSKSPLEAVVVCRNCGARSPFTPRGQARLQELFGELANASWNPALNGFVE
jgi:predicted RNA-binding Zn-ribbon protein involved in translation (DUF1610 family)